MKNTPQNDPDNNLLQRYFDYREVVAALFTCEILDMVDFDENPIADQLINCMDNYAALTGQPNASALRADIESMRDDLCSPVAPPPALEIPAADDLPDLDWYTGGDGDGDTAELPVSFEPTQDPDPMVCQPYFRVRPYEYTN